MEETKKEEVDDAGGAYFTSRGAGHVWAGPNSFQYGGRVPILQARFKPLLQSVLHVIRRGLHRRLYSVAHGLHLAYRKGTV